MKEAQQFFSNTEPDETLVTPRFDENETVQAQPVVPLADVPPADTRSGARRRSWPLALVLVSALVGSVAGGAGLYVYQRRATQDAPSNTEPAPTPASAEAQQPSTPPGASEETASLPTEPTASDAEMDAAPQVEASETVEPVTASAPETDAAKKKETEKASAPAPRKAPEREDDDNRVVNRRGRQGGQEAPQQRQTRDDYDEGGARLSDEIVYPRPRRAERREQRRAERRERRANRPRNVDRVRGIFEGQP